MNRLQLVAKLHQKAGAAGADPTTTVGHTGEMKDLVDQVEEAWHLIQAEEPFWKWMRKDFSFTTTGGKIAYLPNAGAPETGITDWAMWLTHDSWRAYKTSVGRNDESFLVGWDYQIFRDTFDFGTQSQIQQKPSVFSIRDRDGAILLGNTPDTVYTITGQYQQAPVAMAADADTPGMPVRFHMAIVYRAMMIYGSFESASEVYAEGETEYNKLMAALRLDQLDEIHLGDPLA
jgi:hypothetical protein